MGATSSTAATGSRLPAGVNNLVGELGSDVQYERGMGSSRFLKAIKARHSHGPLVVKTFVKPEAFFSLRPLVRRIRVEREALADVPNTLTYQKVVETDTAGYLIRQWMANNLYDRISTRPFLTDIEKKWITFQLLCAMKEARKRNVPHGDLKTENVLVTSSLSVYITDFASSFKQVYLPLNDPSDFNFYFGTSGRRTCYVAPERFYAEGSEIAKQKAKARAEAQALTTNQGSTNAPSGQTNLDAMAEFFKRDGRVTEAMDVFSLGCVIGELWRDGSPMFTLMQLYKYRDHQFDIEPALMEIPDKRIREMVRGMLALDPKERMSFAETLDRAKGDCFPTIFYTFLHQYLMTLQRTSAKTAAASTGEVNPLSSRVASANSGATARNVPSTPNVLPSSSASEANATNEIAQAAILLHAESDERIERMYEEWSVLTAVLDEKSEHFHAATRQGMPGDGALSPSSEADAVSYIAPVPEEGEKVDYDRSDMPEQVLPVRIRIPGVPAQTLSIPDRPVTEDGPALLILSPLLANLRNAIRPSTKVRCLDLLLHLSSRWLSDEAKLDRVLPYIMTLSDDDSVMVRVAVVRAVVQLLSLVAIITPSNVSTFTEYVMPNIRNFSRDSSSLVRATYAACLIELTRIGSKFIQIASAMRAEGIFATEGGVRKGITENEVFDDFLEGGEARIEAEVNFDRQMDALRALIQEQALLLLTDASPAVKRNLLANIGPLCTFFGSALTNDVILSHIITYLNDRSWQLRKAFFDAIVDVAYVAGTRSVEDYILTLLLQALSDPEEFVVLHVLQALRKLLDPPTGKSNFVLSRGKVLDIVVATAGFLCHPNHWLRTSAAFVIARGADQIGTTDVWAILYPTVRPLLRCDVRTVEPARLLFAVKEPITREVLQKAVQWASRAKNSKFWKPIPADARNKAALTSIINREGIGLTIGRRGKSLVRTPLPRNEEDDAHIDSLRSSGLSEGDEVKLVALREYLTKLAKTSNVIGAHNVSSTSMALVNQEDANMLPPLQIRSGLAVQRLDDVTPLTIFFTTSGSQNRSDRAANAGLAGRTANGVETASVSPSMRSYAASSTFSGRMARRRLAGMRVVSDGSVMSPLEELKRRMKSDHDEFGDSTSPQQVAHRQIGGHNLDRPSSPASSASGGGSSLPTQGKLGPSKAQAAVAADSTTAMGTMAEGSARLKTKDRVTSLSLQSGQTTPTGLMTPNLRNETNASKQGEDAAASESKIASTYDGNDPYIHAHLEAVYLANFQERQTDWGPTIPSIASARRRGGAAGLRTATAAGLAAGRNSKSAKTSSIASNRRPEGNLIAYFTEHSSPITAIVVSPDHAFFLSGSQDGSIKIWDTARLEKNVTSRSRGTYSAQRGKIVCLIMLEGSHCAASAATDGSVHVVKIEVATSSSSLPKYGKIRLVSNFQLSDPNEYVVCMLQSARKSGVTTREAASSDAAGGATASSSQSTVTTRSTLILATSKNNIVILDLRTMQVMTTFANPAHLGSIAAMCIDPKNIWLLVATIGGVMCLWDLRFHLLVKTWRLSTLQNSLSKRSSISEARAQAEEAIVRVNSVAIHPSKGKGRWVMIAFERLNLSFQGEQADGDSDVAEELIETWDVEQSTCVEIYETFRNDGTQDSKREDKEVHQVSKTEGEAVLSTGLEAGIDDRVFGLGGASDAIERLVRLHEARLNAQQELDTAAEDGRLPVSDDGEQGRTDRTDYRKVKGREVIPPPAPKSFVRAMLVSKEGYVSSVLPHADQLAGGWLDAGKLASATTDDLGLGHGSSDVAGYMLTAGTDRMIRFWDLGRTEKSVAFGADVDRRHEFKTQQPQQPQQERNGRDLASPSTQDEGRMVSERNSVDDVGSGEPAGSRNSHKRQHADRHRANQHAIHYQHHVYPTPATMRSAVTALRSPLLTHHSSSSTTNTMMKAHKDAITALAIIEHPFRCIVAGDYAGNIRVWE